MPTPTGPDAAKITAEAHRVAVQIDVSRMATRLETEALRLITDLSQRGLTGDELARAVMDGLLALSDSPTEDAGSKAVNEANSLGRNLEADHQVELIDIVVRTAILDEATCKVCIRLDFPTSRIEYVFGSPEYFEDMPPNHCEGQERCRCLYIYRRTQAAA